MKRFYFKVYQTGDELSGVLYRTANNVQEAEEALMKEFTFIDKLEFLRME